MTNHTYPAGIRALASGRLADIDDRGRATLLTCTWLVEVLNGNPEPDAPEDCFDIVNCDAPLFAAGSDGWRCDAGHHHYGIEIEWELAATEEALERAGR